MIFAADIPVRFLRSLLLCASCLVHPAVALSAPAPTTPTVTSKLVTVSKQNYTVYDYTDSATCRPHSLSRCRPLPAARILRCSWPAEMRRCDLD